MTIKSLTKTVLKYLHSHNKTQKDIILITLPRAGSTIVAEVLNMDPHSKVCSEPLAMNKHNRQVLHKYFETENIQERYTDISQNMFSSMKQFFIDLSEGKTWNSFYWSDFTSSHHSFKTNRTIFKTHKLTYLYEDLFADTDDYVICLLRHPISHSLSRMRNKWTTYYSEYSQSRKIKNQLNSLQVELLEQIDQNGSELEKFVLSWCLENYIFIKNIQQNKHKDKFLLLTYEEFIANAEQLLPVLCEKIELDYQSGMLDILNKPSYGIVHSTKETKQQIMQGDRLKILSKWRKNISFEEEKAAFKILDAFDIDVYKVGEDLPDEKYCMANT